MIAFHLGLLKGWWEKMRTKLMLKVTWSLPHVVVYWCGIRLWANATMGPYCHVHPDAVSLSEALKHWEKHEGGDV